MMDKDELLFLTTDELETLTGFKNTRRQAAWLRDHGWSHVENARGVPIVSREYCRQKLAGGTPAAPISSSWQPDFSRLTA